MKIQIHENVLNIKEEDGTIIKTIESSSFIIYPAEGKRLRNKITGYIVNSYVGVNTKEEIQNFEEVE